jgi:predicted nucleic acid-binding protein
MILVDASALVALVLKNHPRHAVCVAALKDLAEPMATVWPAVAKAMELLTSLPRAQDAVWQMIDRGAPRLLSLDENDVARIREVMEKRRVDLPTASLIHVAEREGLKKILAAEGASYDTAGRKLKVVP